MAGKASAFFLVLAVAAILAAGPAEPATSPPAAPAPAPDCTSIMTDKMISCIGFVAKGSTDKAPSKECCDGLASVIKVNTICICQLAANPNNNSQAEDLGIDPKRAMLLPQACKNSIPVDKCAKLGVPIKTPVGSAITSPASASAPSASGPEAAGAGAGGTDGKAPAPTSPATSTWSTWALMFAAGIPALALAVVSVRV